VAVAPVGGLAVVRRHADVATGTGEVGELGTVGVVDGDRATDGGAVRGEVADAEVAAGVGDADAGVQDVGVLVDDHQAAHRAAGRAGGLLDDVRVRLVAGGRGAAGV